MKQSTIVSLLRKEFGHHEVTVFSASAKNRAGVLDCEIAYRGQSFWVEIKIDRDKLRSSQSKFIERHYNNSTVLHFDSERNRFELLFFNDKMENYFSLYFDEKDFASIKMEYDKYL